MSTEEANNNAATVVAVTGATGYIGSHVIRVLLEKGYSVKAIVRDPSNNEKNAFLQELDTSGERLSLCAGNLATEGSFDEPFMDTDFVIHTAATVALAAPDPIADIVEPNVNGMLNVMRACEKAAKESRLKRVIVTSSVAAVADTSHPNNYVFSEKDFNDQCDPMRDPYMYSKHESEIKARDFVANLPDEHKFTIAFVNPGLVVGPLLSKRHLTSSPQVLHDLMTGKFPMAPKLGFGICDVRDVADMHVLLMERADVEGRFIVSPESMWLREIALLGREKYPRHSFPRRALPNFLMYITALFDSRVTIHFCRQNLGKLQQFTVEKAEKELGFKFRDAKQSVLDTFESFLEFGLVDKKE